MVLMAKKNARNRISATLPLQLQKEVDRLEGEGYTPAEIVREGVRLFVQKKRQEAPA